MKFLFYCLESETAIEDRKQIDSGYAYYLWRPSFSQLVPPGVSLAPFGAWWVLHFLRVFYNRDYSIFVVYQGARLIHRSIVTPGYLRFPFMSKNDLQIGDTWTDPEHRNRGIASFAIQEIVKICRQSGRRFWYLVEENNAPSIRAVEKIGFYRFGMGERTKRMGLSLLGTFEVSGKT